LQGRTWKSNDAYQAAVRERWEGQRALQWHSFNESEELSAEKQPKPIDVCVVYDPEFKDQTERNADLFRHLNKANHPDDPTTTVHMIDIHSCKSSTDLQQKMRQIASPYQANGRHLAFVFKIHGSRPLQFDQGVAGMPFRQGASQGSMHVRDLFPTEPNTSSFYDACYGGQHAIEWSKAGGSPRALWTGSENTVNYGTTFFTLSDGLDKPDGKFAADINGDGKVTLAELRYYSDIRNAYQDPVIYDVHGNRIADMGKAPENNV
jgi:hypothetical protein